MLPSCEVVGLVQICFDSFTDDRVFAQSQAASSHFRAEAPSGCARRPPLLLPLRCRGWSPDILQKCLRLLLASTGFEIGLGMQRQLDHALEQLISR
jgi:hypothetical protein